MTVQAREQVVAGGPRDFAEVRHLVVRGTNEEIGAHLTRLAVERHRAAPLVSTDPIRTRATRRYFERWYPIHASRMRGAALALGLDPETDEYDLSAIVYNVGVPSCSAAFYPPQFTECAHGILSRNYDFTTGTMSGAIAAPGEAATARPYVIEAYPDCGFPSLYLCAYNLLGTALDGINSEGLSVALLADNESMIRFPLEPVMGLGVGLSETVVPRFLLDCCSDVQQAKEALLSTKQYYASIPVHYIVADRHGDSFVWEYSHAHNREYIIDGGGRPQVTTNFSLHRYPLLDALPVEDGDPTSMYTRFLAVQCAIDGRRPPYSLDWIKRVSRAVAFAGGFVRPLVAPTRTLWHSVYDTDARSLEVDFYLRDEADPVLPGQYRVVRSEFRRFELERGS